MIPTTYDAEIQRCAARRLPSGYSWWRIKAQLWQESRLNPHAVSNAGAEGIAQFMPDTWPQWRDFCGYGKEVTPFMAAPAIDCCCAYMNHLYSAWYAKRLEVDRWELALASYNAGLGNILKAQRHAEGALEYFKIIAALPAITGATNAKQTSDYVRIISATYRGLEGDDT